MQLQSNAPSLITHNYETLMRRTGVLSLRETTLFSEWRSCFVLFFSIWCIWRRRQQLINTEKVKSSTCYVAVKKQENKKSIDRCDDFQVTVFALMISSSSSQSLRVKFWITLEIDIISTCRDAARVYSSSLYIFFSCLISFLLHFTQQLWLRWAAAGPVTQRSSFPSQVHVLTMNLNLLRSLLPDWLCWLRHNCSSERWKMILNAVLLKHDHYRCPCFFSPDSLCMLPSDLLFSAGPPKDLFWFSGSLHLILIDHRIIFYLNQLNSPENAKKLWRFLFLQGTLMSKLLTPSTY